MPFFFGFKAGASKELASKVLEVIIHYADAGCNLSFWDYFAHEVSRNLIRTTTALLDQKYNYSKTLREIFGSR